MSVFLFYLLCAITDCPPTIIHKSATNNAAPSSLTSAASSTIPVVRSGTMESRFARSQLPVEDRVPPVVSTALGDIQGRFTSSRNGRVIAAFEGLKYAMAPVGQRRFRNPVPVPPWMGELLVANKTAKDCLQLDFSRTLQVRGVEDCLVLNVYSNHDSILRTNWNSKPLKKLLPVIVFFHGGGHMSHSGANYGPGYLLDRDLLLVTVNFRLGVLGYLSTGSSAARGNFALQDQALALKWVSDHISSFGGDPKKITIVGESTGAGAVGLHLLSNVTSRVASIHGAILLSGGNMNHWAIMNDTISNTKKLAKRMHCPTKSNEALVNCLRNKDPYMVVGQQLQLWRVPVISRLLFGPVIESPIDNPTAFITESPLMTYTLHPETVKPVPVISGINKDEGAVFAANVYMIPFLFGAINNQWDTMASYLMAYDKLPGVNIPETSQKIAKFYFNNTRWSFNTRDQISQALGDRTIVTGVHKFLQHHSKVGSTYGYFFTSSDRESPSFLNQMGLQNKDWGVSHGDELPYIFPMKHFYDGNFDDEKEMAISKWWVDVFANFANDSQPFPNNQVTENVTWSPILNPKYNMEVLEISSEAKRMIPFPYMKRMKFWESLNLN